MSAHIDDDLISLADDSEFTSSISPSSTVTTASTMQPNQRSFVKRDSFSDLAVMMKAKKPYTPIPSSTLRSQLAAANSMQFASRASTGNDMLSPLARPYHPDGSVAAHLQNQVYSAVPSVTSPPLEYNKRDMQRLESMLKELEETPIDEEEDVSTAVKSSFENCSTRSLLDFDTFLSLPASIGPAAPPTPARSIEPQTLDCRVDQSTTQTWVTRRPSLELLRTEKRALEIKFARLGKSRACPPAVGDQEDELIAQIGYLRHQNEQSKIQKATMARTLSQKIVDIKQLELELDTVRQDLETANSTGRAYTGIVGERDYIQAQLRECIAENLLHVSNLDKAKNDEIQALTKQLDDLQAARARVDDAQQSEHEALAATRLEAFHRCEKQLKSVNAKYAAEHDKANHLEDLVQDLQGKLGQVGDLQAELRQKSSDCDRWRTKFKNQEKMMETCQQQIERARNEQRALRGAAHLVKPTSTFKLSPLVLGCAECYAKNITCDSRANCRHCTESNEQCVRWRCSLKHVLGQCPRMRCTFPHEEDGWLLATEPRPEW